MKNIFYILYVSLLVISCSSDIEDSATTTGKQIFRFDLKQITAKTATSKLKKLEPAFAIVSINDDSGASILTREKIALEKLGDSYITSEITLESGTYSLVEFIIIDKNNVAISLVPRKTGALALFASNPLPFDFEVLPNEKNESITENINAAGYTSIDFGYTGLSLTFPENTDFFSLTVDDSDVRTKKILMLKSITGSTYLIDWGDGVIEEYVSNIDNSGIENKISHSYSENGIYTINISGAIQAIELLDFGSDQDNGYESHLSSINIENLTLLKTCQLYRGYLSALDTSKNKALEFLGLGNNQIASLDLSNNPKLKTLFLRYNQLAELNISQNSDLDFMMVDGNELSDLDLSKNLNLRRVLVRGNNLSSIDISGNLNLESFDFSENQISNIDISKNLGLTDINMGGNQLSEIDLSRNINLERIDLYHNQISSIDFSKNPKLKLLYIMDNLLSEIDLSANPKLENLIIENNILNTLDFTNNPKIRALEIGGNQFDEFELDQIISHFHEKAITHSIYRGYIDFQNNPGSDNLYNITLARINELISSYDWAFNNN